MSPSSDRSFQRRTLARWSARLATAALTLLVSGCSAALFGAMNATSGTHGLSSRTGIVFDARHQLKLDVYRPANAQNAPVVVFFYGGAWQDGKRGQYAWAGRALARHGVVAVVPDYRKYPKVHLDGFMHDGAEAVAWARQHAGEFGGNPEELFVMGHSAGAHIGALLATHASWLKSVDMKPRDLSGFIGLAGPYDFLPLKQQVYIDLFGTTHAEQEKSQPVHFVNGNEPPMLLEQGQADQTVWPSNAISLATALRAHDEPVTMHIYPGIGHAGLLLSMSPKFEHKIPSMRDAMAFIDAHGGHRQPVSNKR
ncbi:alpha/beta hydrolase [Oleiagrimonas sp. C23AA]|uniref:alpha/beta hydrolase n=1 Tax=Oleiagrimonas sp. C23AA TaxID=2719047 RepID=UPI00141DCC7A|nr:alpha/beta hydrolase [Oleiagrimonas sp. C23AA]NII09994.1 alpha/beta hydrolase [Oleiagrimonas sp. C23AA]